MRMPAGTGAEPHSHPNEQWIYILEGTFRAKIGDQEVEAKPGSVVYVPSERRAFRRRDARRRRGVLHRQGRLAQPARHQGGLIAAATRSRDRTFVSAARRVYNRWETAHPEKAAPVDPQGGKR